MFEVIKPSKTLVDTRKLQADLKQAMEDTTQDGVTFMREYPPQTLTKTGYIRTNILMKSWWKKVYSNSDHIEGIIASSGPPYNKYVEGPENVQSHLMAGAGWQNVEMLVKVVESRLKERLDRIFGSLK